MPRRMPDVGGNVHVRPHEIAAQTVHHLVEAKVVSQGAGADHVKIRCVLISEHDARHLFRHPADDLKLRRQLEILEGLLVINQHGKPFVGGVLAELGEHGLLVHGRCLARLGRQGRKRRRYFIQEDFPIAGTAAPGQRTVKTSRRFIRGEIAEIEIYFRTM